MSKVTELRVLKIGRSIDTPVNFRHRTGDSESGGNMLDLYAQAESVEDVIFGREEEFAKERFLKGFRFYLRKVFTDQEREFLKRFMSGKENPREIGRAMGVNWFDYMQSVQGKAYKNVKPLLKLSKLSGWSGAAEFIAIIFQRLSMLENGAELSEILPQNKRHLELCAYKRAWREAHREEIIVQKKEYYRAHREELRAKGRAYAEAHREEMKAYREAHREEIAAKKKRYNEAHREEIREYQKQYNKRYRETHREERRAYFKAYREKKKAQGAKNE